MDGGVWWATVHGVTQSWTRLSDFTFFLSLKPFWGFPCSPVGLCAFTAGFVGSISGWGTKIPHAVQCSQKKEKKTTQTPQANK